MRTAVAAAALPSRALPAGVTRVILVPANGHKVETTTAVVEHSDLINEMLGSEDDFPAAKTARSDAAAEAPVQEIPLPNVASDAMLVKILAAMAKMTADPIPEAVKPENDDAVASLDAVTPKLPGWAIDFARSIGSTEDCTELEAFTVAVNYLEVPALLRVLLTELGIRLKDKTAVQIRKVLRYINDWGAASVKEQDEMFAATQWCGPEKTVEEVIGYIARNQALVREKMAPVAIPAGWVDTDFYPTTVKEEPTDEMMAVEAVGAVQERPVDETDAEPPSAVSAI